MSHRRLLELALVIAVALVTAVSVATDVIDQKFGTQTREMTGGDMQIRSNQPLDSLLNTLPLADMAHAEWVTLNVMASAGEQFSLITLKAVSGNYPLAGRVTIETADGKRDLRQGPPSGEVWIQPVLGERLGVGLGDTLWLGDVQARVSAWLLREPDATGGWRALFPRAMVSRSMVDQGALVRPGSRATWSLALAGPAERLDSIAQSITGQNNPDIRILRPGEGRDSVSRAVQRARGWLMLVVALGVLLAAVAAGIALAGDVERLRLAVALHKALGADRQRVLRHLLLPAWGPVLMRAGLGGVVLGLAVAGVAVLAMVSLAGQAETAGLGSVSVHPGWMVMPALTLTVLIVCLVGPSMHLVLQVPPLRVLRAMPTDEGQRMARRRGALWAWTGLTALVLIYTGSLRMTAILAAGVVVWWGVWNLAWMLALKGVRGLVPRTGLTARALERIDQMGWRARMMSGALGLVWCLVVVLMLFRNELLGSWAEALQERLPNQFLINVMPEERAPIETFLRERGVDPGQFYPVFRGRLTAINGEPASARQKPDEHVEALHRPLNLTWTEVLQEGNEITDGQWAAPASSGVPAISVEAGLAARLGLRPGDRLQFDVGGTLLEAEITSLREVDWESFRPNFYVIFHAPPPVMNAVTWMTSFHLPPGDDRLTSDLLSQWPGVTVLDVRDILGRVRTVVGQVSSAIEILLWLMCAGAAIAVVALAREEAQLRYRWVAVSRALGATRGRLMGQLVRESALAGMLSGALAVLLGWAQYGALAHWVFELPVMAPGPAWLAIPLLAGAVQVILTWRQHRSLMEVSPMNLLRA